MMYLLLLLLLHAQLCSSDFTTLKEFTEYANHMPEYPANDTNDWLNPDYTHFYSNFAFGLKRKLVEFFHLQRSIAFPLELVLPLLREVTDILQKTSAPGRLVKKVAVDTGVFYIWGELNGAFHSLVRSLNELEHMGVIDDNLRILTLNTHLVFIGDVLNRSPYMMETAFLILRLIQMNPRCVGHGHDSIFFLKGKAEDRQEWLTNNLGKELSARYPQKERNSLIAAFNDFYHSVPLAIYVMPEGQTGEKREAVRISYFGPGYDELDETFFPYFFDEYARPTMSLARKIMTDTQLSINIRAYIYAGSFSKKKIRQAPLSLLAKNNTSTEWSIFSSPTANSRRLYQFFDDAFVMLKIIKRDDIAAWTLTLFRQDTRTPTGFIQEQPFNLLSGERMPDEQQQKIGALQKELADLLSENRSLADSCAPPAQAKHDQFMPVDKVSALQGDRFVIGSTMDLSRQFKVYCELLKSGLNLPIDAVNNSGGIGGKKIQMVYSDDGYESDRARKNVENFLQETKTDIVLSPMGTGPLSGYLDMIKNGKVTVLFPNSGSYRFADYKNIIHLRTSYLENGYMVARAVAPMLRNKKVAFFFQNNSWGRDAAKGARQALEELGNTNFLEMPVRANSIAIDNQIAEIKAFNPDGLALFCSSRTAQECIKQLGGEFLQQKILFGDNALGSGEFIDVLREKGLRMTRAQVVPNPVLSQLPIVKDFRAFAQEANVPIDIISLEGYINGALFTHVLETVKDNYSRENLIKACESIKDYDFKGLKLTFDPHTRQLLHTVWINSNDEADWVAEEVLPIASDKENGGQESDKNDLAAKAHERLSEENNKPLMSEQETILKIGSTMDLSKGVKGLSEGYKSGLMLKLDALNAAGGVNSLIFQLNVADDVYEPNKARENIDDLMQNLHIDLLLAPLGTPTTKAYIDLIEQGKLLVLFPIARSLEFRRPELINVIQYQPSLEQEATIATRYMLSKHNISKIAVFYQNDDFGIEPKDAIERLLKTEYPGVEMKAYAVERNNVNFKEQVEKIKDFKPDALAMHVTSPVVEEFVRQAGPEFLHGKYLYGGSWLMVEQMLKGLQEKGLHITILSLMPDPETSDVPLAREYKEAVRGKNTEVSVLAMEGYLYMSLLALAVKDIELPLTKEKIITYFEHMQHIDYKGIKLNFNPQNRTMAQNVWMYDTRDNSWVEQNVADASKSPTL